MKVYTREELAALDLLERPMWVFDVEQPGIWWANQAAVVLWRAEDLPSLLARDLREGLSEASVQRLADHIQRAERGERVVDQWTIYPGGVPVPLIVRTSPIHIDDGRLALLTEGTPEEEPFGDRASLRGIEALRHLPVAVCQFDHGGQVVFQNPEALRIFGPSEGLLGMLPRRFVDRIQGERVLREAMRGDRIELQAPMETLNGPRWFQVTLNQSTDPVLGGPIILLTARDITEHKRDQDRLEQAKEAAESASRAKSVFLATLTHELRTPLSSTLGFAELLDATGLDHEQRGYLRAMREPSRALLGLIDDLLDLSRLDAGDVDIDDVPVELDLMIRDVVDAVTPRAQAKGLSLRADRHPELPATVRGDPRRLQQILRHLLDNAAKFTGAGEIVLRALPAGERGQDPDARLRFEVEDTGPGIPAEQVERIFEAFTQIDTSTARPHGGTGLGLAVCRLLAERMGGTIGAHSEPGAGSRFWLELPMRTLARRRPDDLDDGSEGVTARRILIVEDNPVNQVLVRTVLKKLGHRTTVVANGRAALQAIEGERFDLVLMDIQMPEMDGVEATRAIRARGLGADHLPIIALTANLTAESRPVYLDAGMNECIGKPFRVQDLAAAIDRWAGARRAAEP